jgi:hypothetical protein
MPTVRSRTNRSTIGSGPGRIERRAAEAEEVRHRLVGVDAGGDHDVEVDLLVDALDAWDEPTQSDHGRVDDGVDAEALEFGQPRDRVGDALLLVPLVRVVLLDVGGEHEDVLVHEGRAQRGRVDLTSHRRHHHHP